MMDVFGRKKSESFDSCCSELDEHLTNHYRSHPQLAGLGHHQHNHHHHHQFGPSTVNGMGNTAPVLGGSNNAIGSIAENKINTSNRSSTGTSSCGSRRKVARWDQPENNHSSGSLLSTMQRFVQTVDDMNENILVPCRLMDLKFDEKVSKPSPATAAPKNAADPKGHLMANLNGVDLFQFYAVLNSVKNDLMWGSNKPTTNNNHGNSNNHHHHHNNHHHSNGSSISSASSISSTNNSSSVSLASSAGAAAPAQANGTSGNGEVKGHVRRPSTVSTTSSASVSDTEFSELNEDSGVEGEEEYSQQMSDAFHHHLSGLQHCLKELTLAADYITTRYNNDLGGANL